MVCRVLGTLQGHFVLPLYTSALQGKQHNVKRPLFHRLENGGSENLFCKHFQTSTGFHSVTEKRTVKREGFDFCTGLIIFVIRFLRLQVFII